MWGEAKWGGWRIALCLAAFLPLEVLLVLARSTHGGPIFSSYSRLIFGLAVAAGIGAAPIIAAAFIGIVFGRLPGRIAAVIACFLLLGIEVWTAAPEISLRRFPRLGWWIIPIAVVAAAVLRHWHYVSGHAWATPERRARLWERKRHKWLFDEVTGEWRKIVSRGIGHKDYIVDTRSRDSRLLDESTAFEWRINISTLAHFLGVMFLLLSFQEYVESLNGRSMNVWDTFLVFGLICEAFVWFQEWLYRSGMPVWIPFDREKVGVGGIVCDPPPREPDREPFGQPISQATQPPSATPEYQIPL